MNSTFRPLNLVLILCVFAIHGFAACKEEPRDMRTENKAAALKLFAGLQQELGGTLKKTIKADGVAAAISKCKAVSPALESAQSTNEVRLRRISERFRNPDHAPDPWEASILAQWKVDMADGRTPGVLTSDTDEGFRVMKPILISNGLCLQCHGTPDVMNPDAAREIARLYPEDKATGYKLNELRGAFSAVFKK